MRVKITLCILAISLSESSLVAQEQMRCELNSNFDQFDENGKSKQIVLYDKAKSRGIAFHTDLKVNTDGSLYSYYAYPSAPFNTPRYNTVVNGAQLKDPISGKVIFTASGGKTSEMAILKAIKTQHNREWRRLPHEPIIDWVGIETYSHNGVVKPCNLTPYYVSKTNVKSGKSKISCSQDQWLDSKTVPSIVIPKDSKFIELGVQPGDLALIYRKTKGSNKEKIVFGIVGDLGPTKELGEASIAMIEHISGKPPNPPSPNGKKSWKYGYSKDVLTVVFPNTSRGHDANYGEIDKNAELSKEKFVRTWGSGDFELAMVKIRACKDTFADTTRR